MSDGKVKIEVQLEGSAGAAQGVEKLQKTVEELGGAQAREGAAAKQATTALQANTAAQNKNAGATDKATKAVQGNTKAQQENAKAATAAGKAAGAAGGGLKEQGQFAASANKAMGSLETANMAFVRLMQGDVVGAVKLAGRAVKDFFSAIVANPALLAIAALVGAVAGVAKAWKDAKAAHEDYVRRSKELEELEKQANLRINGPQDELSSLDDKALEELHKKQRREYRDANNDAEQARGMAQGWNERAENLSGLDWFADWFAGNMPLVGEGSPVQNQAKKALEDAKEAEAAAQAAKDRLDAIEAEIARRKEAQETTHTEAQTAADTLAESRAKFERQKYIDERVDEVRKKHGDNSAEEARFQYQIDDLKSELEAADTAERRLEIEKQIYELRRQRAQSAQQWAAQEKAEDERKEQAAKDEEKRNRDAQADWERSRKLRQMDAAERVTALRAELGELKKGPRNAETEARMRRVIDELDQAKAQAKSEAEKAARDIAAAAEKADAGETQRAAKERRGGFVQFGKWGGDDEDGEGKRGGIRKSAAQRAAEARRQGFLDQQADQRKRAAGLSQWHTTTLGPRTGWRFGRQDKPEKKSPEAEATEKGNKILEEIREALK